MGKTYIPVPQVVRRTSTLGCFNYTWGAPLDPGIPGSRDPMWDRQVYRYRVLYILYDRILVRVNNT